MVFKCLYGKLFTVRKRLYAIPFYQCLTILKPKYRIHLTAVDVDISVGAWAMCGTTSVKNLEVSIRLSHYIIEI
jgi:hypothetical protein